MGKKVGKKLKNIGSYFTGEKGRLAAEEQAALAREQDDKMLALQQQSLDQQAADEKKRLDEIKRANDIRIAGEEQARELSQEAQSIASAQEQDPENITSNVDLNTDLSSKQKIKPRDKMKRLLSRGA